MPAINPAAKLASKLWVEAYTQIVARPATATNTIDVVSTARSTIRTVSVRVTRARTSAPPSFSTVQATMTFLHRDSVERGGGLRVVDWYLNLNFGQKIVVGVLSAVGVFLVPYFASLAFLSSAPSDRNSPQAGASALSITSPKASSATPFPESPDIRLKITSARWEGEKALVDGSWKGDVSSVHCDLLQGGSKGSVTDWWDRSVGTSMDWSGQTFTQDFVKARGRKIEDPIDPTSRYTAVCSAQFSGGWSMNNGAAVEGAPRLRGVRYPGPLACNLYSGSRRWDLYLLW